MVYILLGEGFEEGEAILPADLLPGRGWRCPWWGWRALW